MFGCIEIAKHELEVKGQAAAGIACPNCSFGSIFVFTFSSLDNLLRGKFWEKREKKKRKGAAGIARANCSFESIFVFMFLFSFSSSTIIDSWKSSKNEREENDAAGRHCMRKLFIWVPGLFGFPRQSSYYSIQRKITKKKEREEDLCVSANNVI